MADFKKFAAKLAQFEGGYQADKNDKGNYNSRGELVGTNYGISARFYEGIIKRPPTVADMKAITKSKAQSLFKTEFWDDYHADTINDQAVAEIITDHGVNGGEKSIAILVQGILKNVFKKDLKIDGDIGPTTARIINEVDPKVLYNQIKDARKGYYGYITGTDPETSSLGKFLKSFGYKWGTTSKTFYAGWINRVNQFTAYLAEKKKGVLCSWALQR